MRSFVKINSSQTGEITLSTTDMGESYPSREIFRSKILSFYANREIKIIVKTSGFTVRHGLENDGK